ncbi:FAD/FMN-containing dehydrogenase [Microbacterium resistens]|uniref:FAD/FMN-containing dehydrogenase n=1 Tax=Microbacterium resistens TaxID=156977 RepID=A0ABU1S9U1_9MICO|nr:FAD-binding oxidoreductase [Microbacterium resistens]MDR6865673.1 FAD/FMN-containing dehydrogenase [Microbacterium resistens]
MTGETDMGAGQEEAHAERVRPESAEEVAVAIRHAADRGRPVAVLAGGHGHWPVEPGGLLIDLGALSRVEVDGTRVAIGGGAVWGRVAGALEPHGLAISSGDTASVGVGGLTVGGGLGWMARAWGAAVDQLVGAQVVTADGRIVEASAEENPDLFWALRGGGGNVGIVTRFDFEAHPLPGIAFAEYTAGDDAEEFLRAVRELMRTAPRELTVTFMDVPPMDPSAPAGARLSAVWAGEDAARLAAELAPVAGLSGVSGEVTRPRYREILMEMPEAEPGQEPPGFLGGNGLYADLGDDLIERLVAFRRTYPASVLFLRSLGGAFGDVPQDATPFPGRDATWFVMAGAFDVPGLLDDAGRAAVERDWSAISTGRLAEYGNFVDSASAGDARSMFTPAAYERLARIKAEWDPQNLFRGNHNVPPSV